MGPNEIVVAAQQLEVFFQPLLGACVAQCPSKEIGRALPNGQIEPLDERRVQLRRVLRVKQSFFETPRRSEHFSSFDLHDTIVPSSFENLTVETSDPDELPRISISARNHQPRRLAVPPFLSELSRCRGSTGPARHHGFLRSRPTLVHQVRPGIRSRVEASTRSSR